MNVSLLFNVVVAIVLMQAPPQSIDGVAIPANVNKEFLEWAIERCRNLPAEAGQQIAALNEEIKMARGGRIVDNVAGWEADAKGVYRFENRQEKTQRIQQLQSQIKSLQDSIDAAKRLAVSQLCAGPMKLTVGNAAPFPPGSNWQIEQIISHREAIVVISIPPVRPLEHVDRNTGAKRKAIPPQVMPGEVRWPGGRVWMEGPDFSTDTDGHNTSVKEPTDSVFFVASTKTYSTVSGGSSTILRFVEVDVEATERFIKAHPQLKP